MRRHGTVRSPMSELSERDLEDARTDVAALPDVLDRALRAKPRDDAMKALIVRFLADGTYTLTATVTDRKSVV